MRRGLQGLGLRASGSGVRYGGFEKSKRVGDMQVEVAKLKRLQFCRHQPGRTAVIQTKLNDSWHGAGS